MKLTPLQKRAARKARHGNQLDMNLVSLIDVFTILIFFLLSNSGVETLPATGAVHLPESSAKKEPKETLVVVVNATEITVDGRKVADVAPLAHARRLVARGLAVFTRRLARDRLARLHHRALARHRLGGQRRRLALVGRVRLGRLDLGRRLRRHRRQRLVQEQLGDRRRQRLRRLARRLGQHDEAQRDAERQRQADDDEEQAPEALLVVVRQRPGQDGAAK